MKVPVLSATRCALAIGVLLCSLCAGAKETMIRCEGIGKTTTVNKALNDRLTDLPPVTHHYVLDDQTKMLWFIESDGERRAPCATLPNCTFHYSKSLISTAWKGETSEGSAQLDRVSGMLNESVTGYVNGHLFSTFVLQAHCWPEPAEERKF